MGSKGAAKQREQTADAWQSWVEEHGALLDRATEAQRVLLEAAVRFMAAVGGHHLVARAAAFFLLHAGMGLSPAQVGAAIGRTDRAMRTVQSLSAHDFVESIWGELGRHRQPKLHAEHAGPIAKYLVEHPTCTHAEVAEFVDRGLGIQVDDFTLGRFLKAYGLEILRQDRRAAETRPFPSAAPDSAAPSSCSRSRSR